MNKKILIAYFSHEGEAYVSGKIVSLPVGNTHVTAEMMEELTGAEVFRIEPVQPYPYNYMETIDVAKKELLAAARPEIQGELPNIDDYDTVVLGYPNWWGTFPMIVATFLESADFSGKTILPLCTNEGSGMGSSERDIQKLCPNAIVKAGLPITGGQVKNAQPQIEAWLRKHGLI